MQCECLQGKRGIRGTQAQACEQRAHPSDDVYHCHALRLQMWAFCAQAACDGLSAATDAVLALVAAHVVVTHHAGDAASAVGMERRSRSVRTVGEPAKASEGDEPKILVWPLVA